MCFHIQWSAGIFGCERWVADIFMRSGAKCSRRFGMLRVGSNETVRAVLRAAVGSTLRLSVCLPGLSMDLPGLKWVSDKLVVGS